MAAEVPPRPLEPEELLSASDAARMLERVQLIAAENDQLRAQNEQLLTTQLALLEAKSELELQLKSGGAASGGDARSEWQEMQERVQVLLTENSMLEAASREADNEVQAAQRAGAEAQSSLTEAIGAAQRALEAQKKAEEAAQREQELAARAEEEAEAARAALSAETRKVGLLQAELPAAREETVAAHREVALLKQQLERVHARSAEAARAMSEDLFKSRRAEEDLREQLQVTQGQLSLCEHQLEECRAQHKQLTSEHEQVRASLNAADQRVGTLQLALQSAQEAQEHADAARVAAEDARAEMVLRLERQSELMEKQGLAARAAAHQAANTHAAALASVRSVMVEDARAASEKQGELQSIADGLRAQLARESRQRVQLEQEVGALTAAAAAAAKGHGEESVRGDEGLRLELERTRKVADEAIIRAERLEAELKQAGAEAARLRSRAEGAERAAEREQIRRTRAVSAANAERDAMREQMAARGKAADMALAEAAQAEERLERERSTVHHYAKQQEARAFAQKTEAETMLRDSLEAVANLQDMLVAQQQLAESYRAHALECVHQLQQLGSEEGAVQAMRAQMARTVEAVQALQTESQEREAHSQYIIMQLSNSLAEARAESELGLREGLESLRLELHSSQRHDDEPSTPLED